MAFGVMTIVAELHFRTLIESESLYTVSVEMYFISIEGRSTLSMIHEMCSRSIVLPVYTSTHLSFHLLSMVESLPSSYGLDNSCP